MRLLPRRSRHRWIIFLLCVCLVGVFLAYRGLTESEGTPHTRKHSYKPYPIVKEKTSNDPKMPVNPDILAETHLDEKKLDVKVLKPSIEDNFIMHNVRNLENDDDYLTDEEINSRLKALLLELTVTDWKNAKDADEMMIQVKSELSDLNIDSKLSCREIDSLKLGNSHGYGSFYGKKNIDPVRQGYEHDYTIKSVGTDTELKAECLKQDYNFERCSVMGNYKLMKELVYLVLLKHPMIIKLEGFCLRGETVDARIARKGALLLTETSRPARTDTIANLHWVTRLEISVKLMGFLEYLENSPVGSLAFDKLQFQDFVLVGSGLRLVDLDNLRVGEYPCRGDSDCTIREMSRKELKCVSGQCRGHNTWSNLLHVYKVMLMSLLKNPPGNTFFQEVQNYMEKIQNLEVNIQNIKETFTEWIKLSESGQIMREHPKLNQENQPQKPREDTVYEMRNNKGLRSDEYIDRHGVRRQKHPDQYLDFNGELKWKPTQKPQEKQEQGEMMPARESYQVGDHEYEKVPNANFPGLHDYTCQQSRVSWGCVISVRSLKEAFSHCDQQEKCASFVIFSSNPEVDAVMTMVMKNSVNGRPDPNYGATLFKKKDLKKQPEARLDLADSFDQPAAVVTSKPRSDADMKTCLKKAGNQTRGARSSRERRLMTHLGLKGIEEEDWLTYAEFVKIAKYLGPSQMASKSTSQGRFRFQYMDNALGLKKGELLQEDGLLYHHTGYLMTYHLDRILGLYHTPPAVARKFTRQDLEKVKGDSTWKELILPTLIDNIAEPAVITVPMPPVMKVETLSIEDTGTMVSSVEPFTRNQKVHLEYILLWSLTKQSQPQHGYLGYKGHLIHFEADLAFNNIKKSLIGYFYHCQFPNSVYKTLVCYKCSDTHKMSRVCGLGEEVFGRMKKSGYGVEDIETGSLTRSQMIQIINNSAASILAVVEHCIKNSGREKVLY